MDRGLIYSTATLLHPKPVKRIGPLVLESALDVGSSKKLGRTPSSSKRPEKGVSESELFRLCGGEGEDGIALCSQMLEYFSTLHYIFWSMWIIRNDDQAGTHNPLIGTVCFTLRWAPSFLLWVILCLPNKEICKQKWDSQVAWLLPLIFERFVLPIIPVCLYETPTSHPPKTSQGLILVVLPRHDGDYCIYIT